VTAHRYGPPTASGQSPADDDPESHYEIRVAGHLATRWSAWFDGLAIACDDDGTTVIRGPVVDQAALHGLLQKLRDVGIPLVSVTPVTSNPNAEPSGSHNPEGELT
jgi:hypothetical protein